MHDRRRVRAVRVEPCACGGLIVAQADDDAIVRAVRDHNWSPVHRDWRRRREMVIATYWHKRSLRREVGYRRTSIALRRDLTGEYAA